MRDQVRIQEDLKKQQLSHQLLFSPRNQMLASAARQALESLSFCLLRPLIPIGNWLLVLPRPRWQLAGAGRGSRWRGREPHYWRSPKEQTAYLPSSKYDCQGGLEVSMLPMHMCVYVHVHAHTHTYISVYIAIHKHTQSSILSTFSTLYYRHASRHLER